MDEHSEQRIREQAHALWEKEGSPHGRDVEFWERARLMVEAETVPAPSREVSEEEHKIDEAMKETFPASDPPAFVADRAAVTR